MKGVIDQGIVPAMFAEGGYNKRLKVIADPELPAGSVLWMFDQTEGRRQTGAGRPFRIAGTSPRRSFALSSEQAVKAYVTDLLDSCAKDGGFMLQNGAVLDDAKGENLKTMIETARNSERIMDPPGRADGGTIPRRSPGTTTWRPVRR